MRQQVSFQYSCLSWSKRIYLTLKHKLRQLLQTQNCQKVLNKIARKRESSPKNQIVFSENYFDLQILRNLCFDNYKY